jgi:protein-L-isoaspartate(D-aspartate) O-methyltransferase
MDDLAERRARMVEHQLRRRGIRDRRVLEAMNRIPRELFVPLEYQIAAYEDAPIGIGFDQTISQPYMAALMSESLMLKGHERVLDVGTGSGYQAAILAELAREVYSIELIPELAGQARRNLAKAGYAGRVEVIAGDGSLGYAAASPYDGILVAAGAPDVPRSLIDQLADPGRLVIPVGSYTDQDLEVITKLNGQLTKQVPTLCRFVPLRGAEGWKD